MAATLLHIADWLLWGILAVTTLYILIYVVIPPTPASPPTPLQGERGVDTSSTDFSPTMYLPPSPLGEGPGVRLPGEGSGVRLSFLILFPAYKEDNVIVHSVETFLHQDYPVELFHVAVVSDHMLPATNERLSQLSITLLTPQFDKSSKAKALQFAIENVKTKADYVVVLDADNVVAPDFLTRLAAVCRQGHRVVQCHRTAKNSDNGIAVLDGLSEEINNSIFRKGHNRLGLSSALIGSGMCLDYEWFAANVGHLNTAVEDRELEALLLWQGIHIHYADDIFVMDEKVSSHDNFQRQRLRWMTGQVQTLLLMLPRLPKALVKGNWDYVDKTVQQALIPRSLMLVGTATMAVVTTAVSLLPFFHVQCGMFKLWWCLLAAQALALFIAIPSKMRTRAVLSKVVMLPRMAWQMLKNLTHINTKNKEFLHTTHGQERKQD